ncbi:VOC family protein [Streptomyces sp. B1866]|uniref:VOC family protein n=1 Tax=Streptomyces sp. B1866 TaxID=3075431 RepID=UPI00288F96BB|nr:VOC family protein [Streptomyces sp. B1866]MDT3400548.1 VOC family protein [Streptomyces sp. B1866]
MAAFAEGVPCWADAMLPDLSAGKRFYGELLGWTFGASEPGFGYYTQAYHDGANVAALAPKTDGRMPTVWNVYFAAHDAYATAARIRQAGGQLVAAPLRLGAFGTIFSAADPVGAVFGVWEAGSHAGFEKEGAPGSYAWTEVYTHDPQRVDPFYRHVFGYGSARSADPAETDYVLWSPRGEPTGPEHAVCGRALIDNRFPAEMPAHFLTYFMVEDCDDAVRTAVRLGGRVLRPALDAPDGRYAILSDDQGARFAVVTPAAGIRGADGGRP